eukprot:RCo021426
MGSPVTAVVIDGYYLYRSLDDLGVTDLDSAVRKVVLHIQEVTGSSTFPTTYFYTSDPKHYAEVHPNRRHQERMEAFLRGLQGQGINVDSSFEFKDQNGQDRMGARHTIVVQAGVDCALAVQLTVLALSSKFQNLVLLAGDGDLKPAAKFAEQRKKKTLWIAGFGRHGKRSGSVSEALLQHTRGLSQFIDLTPWALGELMKPTSESTQIYTPTSRTEVPGVLSQSSPTNSSRGSVGPELPEPAEFYGKVVSRNSGGGMVEEEGAGSRIPFPNEAMPAWYTPEVGDRVWCRAEDKGMGPEVTSAFHVVRAVVYSRVESYGFAKPLEHQKLYPEVFFHMAQVRPADYIPWVGDEVEIIPIRSKNRTRGSGWQAGTVCLVEAVERPARVTASLLEEQSQGKWWAKTMAMGDVCIDERLFSQHPHLKAGDRVEVEPVRTKDFCSALNVWPIVTGTIHSLEDNEGLVNLDGDTTGRQVHFSPDAVPQGEVLRVGSRVECACRQMRGRAVPEALQLRVLLRGRVKELARTTGWILPADRQGDVHFHRRDCSGPAVGLGDG